MWGTLRWHWPSADPPWGCTLVEIPSPEAPGSHSQRTRRPSCLPALPASSSPLCRAALGCQELTHCPPSLQGPRPAGMSSTQLSTWCPGPPDLLVLPSTIPATASTTVLVGPKLRPWHSLPLGTHSAAAWRTGPAAPGGLSNGSRKVTDKLSVISSLNTKSPEVSRHVSHGLTWWSLGVGGGLLLWAVVARMLFRRTWCARWA